MGLGVLYVLALINYGNKRHLDIFRKWKHNVDQI